MANRRKKYQRDGTATCRTPWEGWQTASQMVRTRTERTWQKYRTERKNEMYTYTRRAQYHETDQMGVIHHSNYVKWMEEARIRFLKEIGIDYRKLEEDGIISPIVEISVSYKKTVDFDDEVQIGLYVKKYNGIRLEVGYEMRNCKDGEICTTAYSKSCFTKDGNIVSLKKEKPELDAKIRKYMEEEAW